VMPSIAALLIAKGVATVASLTWNYLLYGAVVFRDRSSGGRT
jgi:hypothetical protein